MLTARLQKIFTPCGSASSRSATLFWLALSLVFSLYYSLQAAQMAFSGPFIVQDDARQHVFWMQRFIDPSLFPHDLIADYFQTVAPWGYATFYRAAAWVGVDPFHFNKILPTALGLVTTAYCFGVCHRILASPLAGFIASLLLNQALWMNDDLVSATPRSFLYPLLLAFLYYLSKRLLIPCILMLALQALFYPSIVFISLGILGLRLFRWDGWPRLSTDRVDYLHFGVGLVVAALAILPFALKTSHYGPIITPSQARQLPEFYIEGRTSFFDNNLWRFWVRDKRSGLLPGSLFAPFLLYSALALPFLLICRRLFPLAQKVSGEVNLLLQTALASVGMFIAAHLFLFRFHLPSRYTQHSFRILLSLSAGVTLTIIIDAILQWASKRQGRFLLPAQAAGVVSLILLAFVLVFYSLLVNPFLEPKYRKGEAAALYDFFARQPKDILVASLAPEANNLPTFARRSILVGREYAIPYHMGYYSQIHERASDLIKAQYSPDLNEVIRFIEKYGVDFFIIDRDTLSRGYLAKNRWVKQFQPEAGDALASLEQGQTPAILRLISSCSVFESGNLVVLRADCVKQSSR